MMRYLLVVAALLVGCGRATRPEVLVTLDDGQKLVGLLATEALTLETGMGRLTFDSAVADELGPVDGETVTQSDRRVRLWLRNGSEFVGRWERPALEVELDLGERRRRIEVPITKLRRLQFRGEPIWPRDEVFRVLTRHGDDFFVDVTRTRLPFRSDLGTFDPFLAEVARLQPLDAQQARWRIALLTGSVFNGALTQQQLDLKLAVGPEQIQLPLEAVTQMDKQRIVSLEDIGVDWRGIGRTQHGPEEREAMRQGFYSNASQKAAKRRAQELQGREGR